MSTILKALQRLERDHQDDPDRSLRDEVMKTPTTAALGSRSRFLPVLVGLFLGASVGAALIWFLAAPAHEPVGDTAGPKRIAETGPVAPALPASPSPTPSAPIQPLRSAAARTPAPVASAVPKKPVTPVQHVKVSTEVKETPQDIKVRNPAPFPELLVRKTVWHPEASRRVATLSIPPGGPQQKVHEGDFLGSLVVLEITPSSVLFGRDGVELRKRVGE